MASLSTLVVRGSAEGGAEGAVVEHSGCEVVEETMAWLIPSGRACELHTNIKTLLDFHYTDPYVQLPVSYLLFR